MNRKIYFRIGLIIISVRARKILGARMNDACFSSGSLPLLVEGTIVIYECREAYFQCARARARTIRRSDRSAGTD